MPEKKIIQVKVGTPKVVKSRFGGGLTIQIEDTETLSLSYTGFDRVLIELMRMKRKYNKKYTEMSFEGERDCYCRSDCSCSPTYYLHSKRLETDIEFNFRVEQEKIRDDARRAQELAELERLKEIYDKKS